MGSLNNVWHRCANTVSAVLLAGFVVTGSFTFFASGPKVPHEDLAIKVLTPAILMGEPLRVRTSGVRNKLCITFVARSWRDLESGVILAKEIAPGGFMPLGKWSEDIDLIVPKELGVGDYQLRVLQNNDCGDQVYPLQFPPVTFSIVSHR